jgi:hypothetical protein
MRPVYQRGRSVKSVKSLMLAADYSGNYRIANNVVVFYRIGTHSDVY